MDGTYHDFAMLIQVTPPERMAEWERVLRAAEPEEGMSVNIRKPNLVFFAMRDDFEFIAIDRASAWLERIAAQLHPPVSLAFNAQPSEEI
jgi:hypothetical protein